MNRIKSLCAICALLCLLLSLASCGDSQSELPDLSGMGEIAAVAREDGSGTRAEFESLTGSAGTGIDQIALSTQEILEQVSASRDAIGYVALSAVSGGENVKLLSVNGIAPEESTVKNGKYPLCRSYYVAYLGELSPAASDFMRYLLTAGQGIVAEICIPVKQTATFLSDGSEGTITICGSSSVAPLMERLAEDYRTYNPNATIQIDATDSTGGLTAAIRGECDLAISSRSLKEYEAALLEAKAIASDGVAVVVNPSNPLESLSLEQLREIYDGGFARWADIQ